MACRILFSFSVCSTCFSFTTWETDKTGDYAHSSKHRSSFCSFWDVDRGSRGKWVGKKYSLSVCLISSWHSGSCWPYAGLASPCRSCPSPMSSISQSHRAWRCSKMCTVYYGWTARHAKGIKRMLKQLIHMKMILRARKARYMGRGGYEPSSSAHASVFCSHLQI